MDEEFSQWSRLLFHEFRSGIQIAVVSDLTHRELEDAPQKVRDLLSTVPDQSIENVFLDDEAIQLAKTYIDDGIVTSQHLVDAQHIAIASIEKVDVLASWNFKQIVNLKKIHAFNAVNLKMGYSILEIRSPKEILYEEEV